MDNNRIDIYLAGDSTMAFNTNDRAPRTGWGMSLQQFFKDEVKVHNYAQSGFSTRSYQRSGWLDRLLYELRAGDHVIIQFGHNDKHAADFRPLAHTEVDEFADNLRSWIKRIREIGATPTLVTTTIEWAKDGLHEFASRLAKYNAATLAVAAECGVKCVDLNSAAYERLSRLPMAEIHQYYMATSGLEDAANDYCHLKDNGAYFYASLFVELCRDQNLQIAKYLK